MLAVKSRLISLYYNILRDVKVPNIIKSLKILYIVKIHPENVKEKKYSFFIILKKIIYRFINIAKHYLEKFFFKNKKNFTKCKILIISHLLNENQLKARNDFYFGRIGQIFKKKNFSYQYLLVNHTRASSLKLNNINKNKNKKWLIDDFLCISTELLLIYKQFKSIFWILKNKKIFKNKVSFKNIIFSLFNNETKFALRSNLMIKKYLKKLHPEYLITTYEGFPWERQIFKATKEFNSKIKVIGYQQVFLNSNYKSIFFKLSENYDPDIIWALDNFSKKLFLKSNLKNKKIKVVGNLKEKKMFKIKKHNYEDNKNILVLPEGIESECIKMFKYTLNLAFNNEKFNFFWRVHPVIKIKNILKKMNINKLSLPKNIIISQEKNLERDFENCKFVIYRGSAAAIEALNYGLIPMYLKIRNEPNIDILNSYKKIKLNYIKNSKDFLTIIKRYNNKKYYIKLKGFREDANIIRFKELTQF